MRLLRPKNWGPVLLPGVAVLFVSLGACRPAEDEAVDRMAVGDDPAAVETSGAVTAPPAESPGVASEPAPKPVAVMWKPETAGIARHLPADTSWYVEARHLTRLWEWGGQFKDDEALRKLTEVLGSPGKMAEAAEAAGVEGLDEVPVEELEALRRQYGEESRAVFRSLFGEEVFIAMRGLELVADPFVYYQEEVYPEMVSMMVEAAANGDGADFSGEEALEKLFALLGEESLAGLDELKFLREFEAGGLLGMYWVHEGLVDSMHRSGSWKPLLNGVAEGLAKSTRFESAPLMAESIRTIAALAETEAAEPHGARASARRPATRVLTCCSCTRGLKAPLLVCSARHGRPPQGARPLKPLPRRIPQSIPVQTQTGRTRRSSLHC